MNWLLITTTIMSLLFSVFMVVSEPSVAPKDRITNEQIRVYSDRIIIDLNNTSWGIVENTKSMVPFIDKGSSTILTLTDENDIQKGDIIAFKDKEKDIVIIHRVISKGHDNKGMYFKTRGDNNFLNDKIVRFSQITGVVVGVIY